MTTAAEVDDDLIGNCYTRARAMPAMIGQISMPGRGERVPLPGGPYSVPQIVAFGVGGFLVWTTRGLWSNLGPAAITVAIVLPFVLAFAVRFARVDGRGPLAVLSGWLTYWIGPSAGQLRGRTFRPRAEVLMTGRLHRGDLPVPAPTEPAPQPGPSATAGPPATTTGPSTSPDPGRPGAIAPEQIPVPLHPAPQPPPLPVRPPARPGPAAHRRAVSAVSRRRPASHLQQLLAAQNPPPQHGEDDAR